MLDLLHKVLYAGIGLAAMSEEKIKETVSDLEQRGAVSSEEGKKLAQDLIDKAKHHTDEMKKVVQTECHKVLTKMNLVPREDYEALRRRVESLEKACGSNCGCQNGENL